MSRAHFLTSILLYLSGLALLVGLSGYFLLGLQMRYSGDDYCYASVIARHGFWGAQRYSYFSEATYNGNRYSLTFFSGLADLVGPRFNAFLPGLAILLGIASLAYLIVEISRTFNNPIRWLEATLAGSGLASFLFGVLPDRTQSLYWRSGMLPYLAPIVASSFLFALILKCARAGKNRWLDPVMVFFLALLSGGFSETGLAYQGVMLVIFLAGAVYFLRRRQPWSRRAIRLVISALLGTACAFLLLAFSPTNTIRLESAANHLGLLDLLLLSFVDTIQFFYISLRGLFVTYLVVFSFALCFSMISRKRFLSDMQLSIPRLIVDGLILAGVCSLLIFVTILPSVYAQASYPTARALIVPHWVLVAGFFLAGWIAGDHLGRILGSNDSQARATFTLATLLFLGLCLYPIRWLPATLSDLPKYEKWSALWDARDAQIRLMAAQNQDQVEVMFLDHPITDVSELSVDPSNWYTHCAEQYYGIPSIQADLPGWDSFP